MVVIMPKLDHGDKMFIMGQLKALYKTMLVLQKEIKKLETRRAKDKEKRVEKCGWRKMVNYLKSPNQEVINRLKEPND